MNAEKKDNDKKLNTDESPVKLAITETDAPKLSETVVENITVEVIPGKNSNAKTVTAKESEPVNEKVTTGMSSNLLILSAEENKNEQVIIGIQDKSEVPCVTTKVQIEENSKPEIFVNRPLCADYRSDTDSDTDSDSDSDSSSHSSLSYSSENDSSSSSSDDSQLQNEKKSNKKKNVDCGDLSLCDLPPIENLKISVPGKECQEIGTILNIVGSLVVVQAYKSSPALDIDSVLFLERGQKSLGKIFDVLGPISEPVYTVRFNSKEEIIKNGITPNMAVYCAPKTKYTSFVFVSELMKIRGTDASWKNNEEAPSEFQDFSDDEEERKFKKGKNDPEKKEQPSSSSSSSVNLTRKKVKIFHPRIIPQSNFRNVNPSVPPRPPVVTLPRPLVNPPNPMCVNPQFPPFPPFPRNPFFNPVEPPQPNPAYRCPPQMFNVSYRPPPVPPIPPVPSVQPQPFYPQYPQRFVYPQYMWPPPALPVMPPPPMENIPPRPPLHNVYGPNMINQPK